MKTKKQKKKADHVAEETQLFTPADLQAAIEEHFHDGLAAQMERATDYAAEKQMTGFEEAHARWRSAYIKDFVRKCGNSGARPYWRMTRIVFNEYATKCFVEYFGEKPQFNDVNATMKAISDIMIQRMKNGVKPLGAEPEEGFKRSFFEICKNPLIPKDFILKINAFAIGTLALQGDMDFFGKLAQAFREDRQSTRLSGGGPQDWALRLWLPAGLWRLSLNKGHERLGEALRKLRKVLNDRKDIGASEIANGLGEIGYSAYRKAVSVTHKLKPKTERERD